MRVMKVAVTTLIAALGILGTGVIHAAGDVQYEPYVIEIHQGETLKEAVDRSSPMVEAGRHFHAFTSSSIKWRFRVEESRKACKVIEAKSDFKIRIVIPQLKLTPRVSFNDKQEFARYQKALVAHEKEHAKHATLAARDIRKLTGLIAGTCEEVGRLFDTKAREIVEKYKQESRRYDVVTDHGKRTGAWLK